MNAAIRQVALEYFRPVERECPHRYVEELHQRLGRQLLEVHLFGSIARGDAWPAASPMRSDIDLLAVCSEYPPQADIDDLVNATYPLFLAYGGLDFEGVGMGTTTRRNALPRRRSPPHCSRDLQATILQADSARVERPPLCGDLTKECTYATLQ